MRAVAAFWANIVNNTNGTYTYLAGDSNLTVVEQVSLLCDEV